MRLLLNQHPATGSSGVVSDNSVRVYVRGDEWVRGCVCMCVCVCTRAGACVRACMCARACVRECAAWWTCCVRAVRACVSCAQFARARAQRCRVCSAVPLCRPGLGMPVASAPPAGPCRAVQSRGVLRSAGARSLPGPNPRTREGSLRGTMRARVQAPCDTGGHAGGSCRGRDGAGQGRMGRRTTWRSEARWQRLCILVNLRVAHREHAREPARNLRPCVQGCMRVCMGGMFACVARRMACAGSLSNPASLCGCTRARLRACSVPFCFFLPFCTHFTACTHTHIAVCTRVRDCAVTYVFSLFFPPSLYLSLPLSPSPFPSPSLSLSPPTRALALSLPRTFALSSLLACWRSLSHRTPSLARSLSFPRSRSLPLSLASPHPLTPTPPSPLLSLHRDS